MRLPDDFRHCHADLPDVRLHYVREGAGPPLFLLHGWPGFWWEWHRNIGALAADHDVIVPDMRGFGDSEKPALDRIELYHVNRVVDDTVALMDRLGIERAGFVGHDYGGVLLHKLIRRHPDRVTRAAVINPMVPGFDERYLGADNLHESWYALFHTLDMAAELVGSSREACRLYIGHFLSHWSADPDTFDDDMLDVYVDTFMKPGNLRGGFNFYRAEPAWDEVDQTITDQRMLFLQTLCDPCAPARWSDLVTRWYTNFDIEYVDAAGHFLMVERPLFLHRRLASFFSDAPA